MVLHLMFLFFFLLTHTSDTMVLDEHIWPQSVLEIPVVHVLGLLYTPFS